MSVRTHVDREIDVKRGVRSKIPGQIIFEDGWTVDGGQGAAVVASRAEGKLGGISQAEEFLAAERDRAFVLLAVLVIVIQIPCTIYIG